MTRDEFFPNEGDPTLQAWRERVCPEEHKLLKTVDAAGSDGEIMRAAIAEGRMSVLFDALTRWPDVTDARTLIGMLIAGEHALNERRASVGAVRELLAEFERPTEEDGRE